MNLILLIPLIISLLHSISLQSGTSSSDKKKKKYDDADKYEADVGTSKHDPKDILDAPPNTPARVRNINFKPQNLEKIALYHNDMQEYQSKVAEEMKEELRKHNKVPSDFTFSPYLSMAASLHSIESRHFAKFLANRVLEGLKDADQICRNKAVDGSVNMKDLRKTAYKIKNHYENPSSSEYQGKVLPHHDSLFGESLSHLGISEYDAEGNLVKKAEPNISLNLDNIGVLHDYLQEYEKSFSKELKEELRKRAVKVKFHKPSPYLSMAAAFYGIKSEKFAKFLANQVARRMITNAQQVGNDAWVIKSVRMAHLQNAARKIKEHYEGKGQAGPSSGGSRGGM